MNINSETEPLIKRNAANRNDLIELVIAKLVRLNYDGQHKYRLNLHKMPGVYQESG